MGQSESQGSEIELGTPVMLDWLDAHTPEAGWTKIDKDLFRPEKVRSFGFLLNRDGTAVTIAGDANAKKPLKDDVNRVLTVPIGMVVLIQPVGPIRG